MCGDVPTPGDADDRPPGFAFAAFITSSSVLYGLPAGTTRTSGPEPSIAICSNDLTGS